MQLADALIALALLEDAHAQLREAVAHASSDEPPLEDVSHYLDHALEPLRRHVNAARDVRGPRLRRTLVDFHDHLVLGLPGHEPARGHVEAATLRIREALERLLEAEPTEAADSQP